MKEEKELHLSWADLAIYTSITNINDFRMVLKQACTKHFYNLKLISSSFDPLHNSGMIVDVAKLSINNDVKCLMVGNLLLDSTGSLLEKALDERLITFEYYENHKHDAEKLRDLLAFTSGKFITENEYIKLVMIDSNNTFVELNYSIEKDKEGFVVNASEAGAIIEYSLLASIHLQNPEKYRYIASEKNAEKDFEEWLRYKVLYNEAKLDEWLKNKSPAGDYMKNFNFDSI